MRKEFQQYFNDLESRTDVLSELHIGNDVKNLLEADSGVPATAEENAVLTAFQLRPNRHDTGTGSDTYYESLHILPGSKGAPIEYPNRKDINQEMIDHWRRLAQTEQNPILSLRYSDLVVCFSGKIDYESVKKVIDTTIDICTQSKDAALGCIKKLERAFQLEKCIGYTHRLEDLKKAAINLEQTIAEDEKPGLWGHAFKLLLIDHPSKFLLTQGETNTLITDIDNRITRLSQSKNQNIWAIKYGVRLLSHYFNKINDVVALENVLQKLESVLRNDEYSNTDVILVSNYLQELIMIFGSFSEHDFAKRSSKRITAEMGHLGNIKKPAMHKVSTEMTITNKEVSDFIGAIFEDGNPSLNDVMGRIARQFIPKKDDVKQQLDGLANDYVFLHLTTNTIFAKEGFPIAQFGSIIDDPDFHLQKHLSQVMHINSPFLQWILEELKKRYSAQDVLNELMSCPLFNTDETEYLKELLDAFWNDKYLITSSLAIPYIEDAVRSLYKLSKAPYVRWSDNYKGFMFTALDRLLERNLLKTVYGNLGASFQLYLQTLLCSPIGWNLRNNFAHGINKMNFAEQEVANRLVHVIFCLALVKKNPKTPQPSSEGNE